MLLSRCVTVLAVALTVLAVALTVGCGARTDLRGGTELDGGGEPGTEPEADGGLDAAPDGPSVEPPIDAGSDAGKFDCVDARDCPIVDPCAPPVCERGLCQAGPPVSCDDGDECTNDRCDSAAGGCVFEPASFDLDGDGFNGPRPGFAPGAPGACGDDCDDTSPLAFPGGIEVCDGVDNDCNGIVDDGAEFVPLGEEPVRLSSEVAFQAGAAGLAFNGELYAATYAAQDQRWETFIRGVGDDGQTLASFPPTSITSVNNDSTSGPVRWTGSSFGTVWEDRRDSNYEIYFNRVDATGAKLGADVRVTSQEGFSINPDLIWNGAEFIVAWQDGTFEFLVAGRRLSATGEPVGDALLLSEQFQTAESPRLAQGVERLGLVYTDSSNPFQRTLVFRSLSNDLLDQAPSVTLSSDDPVYPNVAFASDRFVVVYGKRTVAPGDAIWGAAVDEQGTVRVSEKRLTFGASFARGPSLLSLGDRLLLLWADDRDGNYELYAKLLDLELNELSPRQRITFDADDSRNPLGAFGLDGDVGVVFTDNRSGTWQAYFTRLGCVTP